LFYCNVKIKIVLRILWFFVNIFVLKTKNKMDNKKTVNKQFF
jgi:hypothetical protein